MGRSPILGRSPALSLALVALSSASGSDDWYRGATHIDELREASDRLQEGTLDEHAFQTFVRQAERAPDDWRGHAMLGQAQTSRGSHQAAVASLKRARKLAPDVATALATAHDALAAALLDAPTAANLTLVNLTKQQRRRAARRPREAVSLREAIALRSHAEGTGAGAGADVAAAATSHHRLSRLLVMSEADREAAVHAMHRQMEEKREEEEEDEAVRAEEAAEEAARRRAKQELR
ncbi:hypothetical protein EMIHUDRAFT_114904 [Emiliania huxleyi CCMP1516]|uniref:Uncharacterized protein n=2 Tax=Emiliania huxleyi TaxID=2903 RepID=A0A0D3IS73_EMIH1|nr:hypothetical protein EMIHUDRAFT_103574 [Emiliania huxleyi CCMP1516]XP_005779276.1 hypothetical protein EMIHUDRAFT_114904 [Emiliania huxleyi CCMP1516]EOD14108.1 hypothetical protein EMIHUDRAFT_103574 [Emiliania huxleyi CCMP1516]EOD26847.1 hypothetical protein EMIHUDRAFT_114904 [Emiliania huxleyi CCMP1516]|eukprot:XP_005766537.1 hypothetical protein EMIHUDRAFT_103574 [Emiliania huxleyi CCMP1516]